MYFRASGWEGVWELQLDVLREWVRVNFGATFGCRAGRAAERDLWKDSWIYRASNREGGLER